MRGLRPFDRYVESWWHRAAFSSCSDNRDRIVEVTNENRKKRTRANRHERAQWLAKFQPNQLARFIGTHRAGHLHDRWYASS
jgi:hypothetical protein